MEERLNGYEKVRRLDHLLADDIYVYSSPLVLIHLIIISKS